METSMLLQMRQNEIYSHFMPGHWALKGKNLYENIETIAAENRLIEDKDLIFNIDFPMTRDNFAGVAFNALLLTYRDGSSVLNSMVAEGMFTFEDVKAIGNASLTAKAYEVAGQNAEERNHDPTTGITINCITIDGRQKRFFLM